MREIAEPGTPINFEEHRETLTTSLVIIEEAWFYFKTNGHPTAAQHAKKIKEDIMEWIKLIRISQAS